MELQISMNIKDITIPLIIHYYLRHSEHYTNLSTLNLTTSVSSIISTRRWHNAMCTRFDLRHRFSAIPGHSRREVPRRGYWT